MKALQSKLNDLRFTGGYAKKATKVSDSSIASVLTSGTAVNGVQSLEVDRVAKTAYLTGGKVSMKSGVTGEVTAMTQMGFLMQFDPDANNVEKAKHLTEIHTRRRVWCPQMAIKVRLSIHSYLQNDFSDNNHDIMPLTR